MTTQQHPTKYTFDDSTPGWREDRKIAFAASLHELVEDFNVVHNYGKTNGPFVTTEIQLHDPTGVYGVPKPGVHILNIINLTASELPELTGKADSLFHEVMG